MKALTLTQPWAGLVASGIKLVENRSWSPPKNLGDAPFALHASRAIDESVYARIAQLAPGGVFDTKAEWYRLSRVTGAVIGVAVLDGYSQSDISIAQWSTRWERAGKLRPDQTCQERWFFGPFGHMLRPETVCAIAAPVPCRGALGYWRLPADVEAKVVEQIGAAA